MRVRVLFFARAREVAGLSAAELHLDAGASTENLLQLLTAQYPGLDSVLRSCVLALNQEYLQGGPQALKDGDEVAVIPPLSGG
jgi:molybdopterin converting factor subunit 1